MNIQRLVYGTIGLYQIIRFFALGITVVTADGIIGDPALRGSVISLSAASLVTVVLLIQLLVSDSTAPLVPLRIAKVLETVAAGTVMAVSFGLIRVPVVAIFVFGGDIVSLAFLILFTGRSSDAHPPRS